MEPGGLAASAMAPGGLALARRLGTNAEVLGAVVLVRQEWERAEGIVSGPAAPR